MKNLAIVLVMLIGVSSLLSFKSIKDTTIKTENVVLINDYSEGWKDRYCEGWKDVKGMYANCPNTPNCPNPLNSCMEGYRCGYNRGFKAGMKAANN